MSLSSEIISKLMNTGLKITFDEAMSKHTSFQIGGNADALIEPRDTEEIKKAFLVCKELGIKYHIIGNGTNLLVSDKGIRGAVIKLRDKIANVKVCNDTIYADAGALLSVVAHVALENSLSGFERLGGIPGTVGGAVYMNAGAYGAQLSDILIESSYIDHDANAGSIDAKNHDFGYRKSVYTNSDKIITGATFRLKNAPKEQIKEQMKICAGKRRDKQPLTFPSAGSVFKRPEGHFAGALIEEAGLKGFSIGGACVSEKHAGFIINTGAASAKDVLDLIAHIQKTVYERNAIKLECEIKMLGEF